MKESKQYKCVNCGEATAALYKTYGPSVLKLNKCEKCKGIVDKYIEYDPVIVMIDLVLISKEAQRHVLYNTEFKSYWKLFIILMLLETYGVWRNDSLFNIVVNYVCDIPTNSTINSTGVLPLNVENRTWLSACEGWIPEQRTDENDLFIWEKDFYIQFISILTGIVTFILTLHCVMCLIKALSLTRVSLVRTVKAFALSNVSILFTLPMLVWGSADSEHTRALHYALVLAYSGVMFVSVFTVVHNNPVPVTAIVLIISNILKYLIMFHVTPLLRAFVT